MTRTKQYYDATVEIGLPVTLVDTVEEHTDGSVGIPNPDMLLATVAVARVLAPVQMVGAELRFLRHVLDLTGTEFAQAIDLSDKTGRLPLGERSGAPRRLHRKGYPATCPEFAGQPGTRYPDRRQRDSGHENSPARPR